MTLEDVLQARPEIATYLAEYQTRTNRTPRFYEHMDGPALEDPIDFMYALEDNLIIHIHPEENDLVYQVIEPQLLPGEDEFVAKIRQAIFKEALYRPTRADRTKLEADLLQLFDKLTSPTKENNKIQVDPKRIPTLKYHLVRDIARYGILQPILRDPYLEDIQAVGTTPLHVIHKFHGMLRTNVRFPRAEALDLYLRNLAERMGRPLSDARPIIDSVLADGSRINIVYSEDVSRKGPSFSIRRVHEEPISVTQLIAWRTLTPAIAAYLWLCLSSSMNVFICGESASGKTATLNSMLCFIPPRSKMYSAEDTPEVRPPHQVWQRLLTRETGPEEGRVKTFDLLKAALRSRPNCIVVGEIRGAEGAVAFQAMQTGHQTLATFHAADTSKMIQRLSTTPISIPLTFMDNLNVAVFQQAVERNGRIIRRVTAVDELEGYSSFDAGIVTRRVFTYDSSSDEHTFRGANNSFILEKKIAEQRGYEDPKEIYKELDERARVLSTMAERGIFRYDEVNRLLFDYADKGAAGLPFPVNP